jgi:hypothetical protein
LEQLKEAYEGGDENDVLYIAKGIHQPDTNPHMQLKLKRGNGWYTYHLNVAVSNADIPGLHSGYFHWIGVQFAAEDGKLEACWPLVPSSKDTKYRHARKRWSIAPKNVQSTIEAIARTRRETEERENRIEQGKLAEAKKVEGRKVITGQLAAQKWTIPGNKNAGMNKLIEGQTVSVTTQRGKTVNVKFDGGQLKQV